MAAILDLTASVVQKLAARDLDRVFVVHKELDFAAHPCGAGDTVRLLDLPARAKVKAYVERLTAEGAACTIDLKTSEDSPQVLLDDASLNGTGWLFGDGADGDAPTAMKEIVTGAACTLDVVTNTASTDAAKVRVWLEVVSLALNPGEA